jgi:hypothetical protein
VGFINNKLNFSPINDLSNLQDIFICRGGIMNKFQQIFSI